MTLFQVLLMIFLHIVDDYFLQSAWLSNGKQKSWWQLHAPDPFYKHDYLMALAMHSLSWSFMIMIPVAWSKNFDVGPLFLVIFLLNALIHGVVDDLKANKKMLNLIQDKLIHMVQIMFTASLFIVR
ncbi:MAG: hypothetical protein NC489_37075 [Ruminococcus flavefaciens]|nr:hypothetical protein [Ruminococcus flavefaciens]